MSACPAVHSVLHPFRRAGGGVTLPVLALLTILTAGVVAAAGLPGLGAVENSHLKPDALAAAQAMLNGG